MEDTQTFSIHVIGSETGRTYTGEFTARKFLSHRLKLERDRRIRELLGEVNPHVSMQQSLAAHLADCQVSLVSGPPFWESSNFGLDLMDDNVLAEVQGHVYRIQKESIEAVRKKAAEAAGKLKEEVKGGQEQA